MKKFNKLIVFVIIIFSLFAIASFFSKKADYVNFSPGIAHASTLHEDLTFPGTTGGSAWVFTVWKIMLGLANVVVVLVLIALATVNILHINYDTFAIKKSLPLLILGIIMSYFSIFICRMIVDASSVLINTFAQNPDQLATGMLCGMGLANVGSGAIGIFFLTNPAFSLILIIVILLAMIIAIAILSFLLWIRKVVIFLLVAVAPAAFILYAFPPTQSLFKQWWSQFVRWVFMGPVLMFLIWLASMIGAENCKVVMGASGYPASNFSIAALLSMVGVLYLAAIIPFRMGGAVMGAWSKAGKKAVSPGTKAATDFYNRKRDVAKGALTTAYGNTRLGQWMDRGRKFDEARVADYKERRENQMADRFEEIKGRDQRFERTKQESARAKLRLETQENINMRVILDGAEAEATKQEEIALANAKGDVEQVSAEAERVVRGRLGEAQNLREMEVTRAKELVDIEKQERDENIKEGNVENLTQAQIEEITRLRGAEATPVNVKSRYLEQSNRLTLVKERATRRTQSDVEILAQRDSKNNNDLRQTMDELKEAGRGIDSTYALDGRQLAPGATERVTWTQAREAAEQLRYRATTAEGDERVQLENTAQYFDTQAVAFETANANYDMAMVQDLDNRAIDVERQARTAATPEERERLQEQADKMMDASRRVRDRVTSAAARGVPAEIGFRQYYLTNNLAGRRQKIINPDVADEIHTAVISNPASTLYQDVLDDKQVGSGEAKTNRAGIFTAINGGINDLDEAQARGAMIQLGAIHTIMMTARHGETKGLNQINGMMRIMDGAGRGEFKVAAARQAIATMRPENQLQVHSEAFNQYQQYCTSRGLPTPAGADWGGLTAGEQEAALQNLDFEQLNVKGTTKEAVAQRDFVDRFLDRFEEDEGMGLTSSPGNRAARSRAVDARHFTENRP